MAEDYVWIPWDSILEHCEHVKPIRDVIPEFYVSLSPSSPQGGSWQLTEPTIDNTVYSLETSFSPKQDGTPWHSSETNMNPYLYRAEPSLGHTYNTEYLDSVVGGTVAWNQLADTLGVSSPQTNNGITFTRNSDGLWSVTGTATGRVQSQVLVNRFNTVSGHKYLVNVPKSIDPFVFRENNGSLTQTKTSKVLACTEGKKTYFTLDSLLDISGTTVNITNIAFNIFDLTAMFGSTIADYIYNLEQSSAGTGVAWFKELFPKAYYPYNAGELLSVQTGEHWTVGFNQFDSTTAESGYINGSDQVIEDGNTFHSDYIKVFPNTTYYTNATLNGVYTVRYYDGDKVLNGRNTRVDAGLFTTSGDCQFIRVSTTNNTELVVNLSWSGYRNGDYEPYVKRTYPLESMTLRGVPKLDSSGNLYYDGDEYKLDGAVTRKYGVVDLGTLNWTYNTTGHFFETLMNQRAGGLNFISIFTNVGAKSDSDMEDVANESMASNSVTGKWIYIKNTAYTDAPTFKTAMSGVYLVYELATPTTETADPYQQIQICDDFGTEGFTDERTVPIPVGHETRYADVYPIVGWTEINVTVSPTQDAQDGYTTPVPLGQTVYGGTIDVVTGEMTLDMVVDTFDGDSVTSVSSANGVMFARVVASHLSSGVTSEFMCDSYIPSTQSQSGNIVWVSSSQQVVRIFNRGFKNLATAKAALDEQPVHLCYPLATPITVQIPPTEIELFLGQNNIWSDTGENVHIATADDEQTGMIVTVYGKTLWMRSHIFYKDGTDEYTTPIRIG